MFRAFWLEAELVWFGVPNEVQLAAFVELIEACAERESDLTVWVRREREERTLSAGGSLSETAARVASYQRLYWRLTDGRERHAKDWARGSSRFLADARAGLMNIASLALCDGAVEVEWSRTSTVFEGSGDTLLFKLGVGATTDEGDQFWYPAAVVQPWEELARTVVRSIAPTAAAEAAFATVAGSRVPYLFWMGGADSEPWLRDHVFGYYWLNLVGAGATRRLGGVDRVLRDAPAAVKEAVGTDCVYLELADQHWGVTDDQLRALRDFFDPVLPPGEPRVWKEEWGAPPRVFEDRPRAAELRSAEAPTEAAVSKESGSGQGFMPSSFPIVDVIVGAHADPSEFHLAVEFETPLNTVQRLDVERAIEAWAIVGESGGFADVRGMFGAFRSWSTPDWNDDARIVEWRVDLGGAGETAIDVLTNVLTHLGGLDLPVTKLTID